MLGAGGTQECWGLGLHEPKSTEAPSSGHSTRVSYIYRF